MAEFITHEEAHDSFGSKGKTNAALTLGIIGTSLAALSNNGGCCNNGGILGNLFGNNNGNCLAEKAMQMAMLQGQAADNLAWNNRVQSMQDDINMYSYVDGRLKELSDQNYNGRIADLNEKSSMYIDLITRDNVQNLTICDKFTNAREKDITEKANMYQALANRINELEKREAATNAAIPLMFELTQVKANKYTDDCCCKAEKANLIADAALQRQIDHKIDGELKYAYNNLCAPVPNISPLYCTPFTTYGSGTTWSGCCGSQNL